MYYMVHRYGDPVGKCQEFLMLLSEALMLDAMKLNHTSTRKSDPPATCSHALVDRRTVQYLGHLVAAGARQLAHLQVVVPDTSLAVCPATPSHCDRRLL